MALELCCLISLVMAQRNLLLSLPGPCLQLKKILAAQQGRACYRLWCHQIPQYLLGSHFTTSFDHKPLMHIFGEPQGVPTVAHTCIQRWGVPIPIQSSTSQASSLPTLIVSAVGHYLTHRHTYPCQMIRCFSLSASKSLL